MSGGLPSSADGLDESDGGGEFFAAELNDGALDGQGGGLGNGDLEVGNAAEPVAVVGDFEGALGGLHRGGLGLQLRLEQPLRGNLVFDLLEGGQDGLAIAGQGLIINCPGQCQPGAIPPAREDGQLHRRADGPEPAGPIEPGRGGNGLETSQAVEAEMGIEGTQGNADLSVSGGHALLGGGDIGPAFEQFAGQGRQHGGRWGGGAIDGSQDKAGRRLAAESGDGVEQPGAL